MEEVASLSAEVFMTLRVTRVPGNLLRIWFLTYVVWASAKALPRVPIVSIRTPKSWGQPFRLRIGNFGLRIRKQPIALINRQFQIRNPQYHWFTLPLASLCGA
jgi:hypothetical protein